MSIFTRFLAFMLGGSIGFMGMAIIAVGADADRMKEYERRES